MKAARWAREHLLPWVIFLAAWELLSRVTPVPSSLRILWLAWRDLIDPSVASALAGSLTRMAIGFSAVGFLGVGMGMLLGRFRSLDNILGTAASALNAMPGAAWVPLAIFLFGLNQKAVIFTIVLGATGVVMLNTSFGIKDVPPLVLRAAKTMGASGTKIFWHVIIPAALPRIVDGLRLAWAFGWRALMAGELLIGSVHGMGQILSQVAKQRDMEQLLAYMVIIAAIGMIVDGIIFHRLIGGRIRARWGTA
ncbi:MAG: ABC transporter permease subunit [Candidatus Omnitrophica bacterium]|nr:ABC transporter permease subunit [Candidatus Omnitrophota bacterium]